MNEKTIWFKKYLKFILMAFVCCICAVVLYTTYSESSKWSISNETTGCLMTEEERIEKLLSGELSPVNEDLGFCSEDISFIDSASDKPVEIGGLHIVTTSNDVENDDLILINQETIVDNRKVETTANGEELFSAIVVIKNTFSEMENDVDNNEADGDITLVLKQSDDGTNDDAEVVVTGQLQYA